jgi:hypothetical protein
MKPILAAAALLVGSLTPLQAQQASPPVGKWNIEYEAGRRMENGEATPVMGKGVLTIVGQGDTLVATMEAGPRPDGVTPPPMSFGGKMTEKGAVFTQKREGRVTMNGEEKPITVITTWTLTATGDELSGSMVRQLPPELAAMSGAGEPTSVKGTRVKA